jgi:hypothetical protein
VGHENLLSYYPTYALLDEVVSNTGCKKLNLFFDLKNNLQTLYLEYAILNIVENSLSAKYVDTSVFSSLISFISFHKTYSGSRHIDLNFYIFFESGVSYFHTNLSKKYKISRRTDDLYGLDKNKRDYFFEVLQKNFLLIEKAASKLPNVHVIRLQNLEADFVPYYLIRNKLIDEENAVNIVYSNDHDMLQCVNDKTYVFSKSMSGKKLIKQGNVLNHYLKFKKSYPDEYLPIIMAIIGDPGDNVDGIKGIGPKRIEEFIDDFIGECGGVDQIYENVFNEKPLLTLEIGKIENKYMRMVVENIDIVARNLKLVGFEMLSRYIDNPNSTELVEKRKVIENSIKNKRVVDETVLLEALRKNSVYVTDEEFSNLYYQKNDLTYDQGDY